jgi:hypothetical protein
MHGSISKIPSKRSRPYIYDVKFLALIGAPYIYDISRLRVNITRMIVNIIKVMGEKVIVYRCMVRRSKERHHS